MPLSRLAHCITIYGHPQPSHPPLVWQQQPAASVLFLHLTLFPTLLSLLDPEAAARRRHLRHLEFQPPPANNFLSQIEPPSDKVWLSRLELFASNNNSIT